MSAHPHRARKRFGQHFLCDPNVIDQIVAAVRPQPGARLIEIGPGRGVLTDALLHTGCELWAIEIDRDLAALLQRRYRDAANFHLVTGDALHTDYRALVRTDQPLRLVGNLPYNISTPLLFHLLAQRECIQDMHFMLQKEVVDRLAATPGTKAYGRLSVMVQYYCRVEPLFDVPPSAFSPPPKVDSAVVRLTPHGHIEPVAKDPALLENLVNLCFQQRRKTLRNCLKTLVEPPHLDELGAPLAARPETLAVADFVALSNRIGALP
ncbi:MAG: 16S rRNA (adenine(1518)-N(6)/adenine(1519)-N(6))-dimethyltransferase RsmA [Porticoccaceae bacterium]